MDNDFISPSSSNKHRVFTPPPLPNKKGKFSTLNLNKIYSVVFLLLLTFGVLIVEIIVIYLFTENDENNNNSYVQNEEYVSSDVKSDKTSKTEESTSSSYSMNYDSQINSSSYSSPSSSSDTINIHNTALIKGEINVGDWIVFGNNSMQWKVIDIQDNKALIIYCQQYSFNDSGGKAPAIIAEYNDSVNTFRDYNKKVTWETSTLRKVLKEFYEKNFTQPEKELILTTYIVNKDNPYSGTDGGNDTEDKLFILDMEELKKYYSTIGDSIMRGFQSYWVRNPDSTGTSAITFYSGSFQDTYQIRPNEYKEVTPVCWVKLE